MNDARAFPPLSPDAALALPSLLQAGRYAECEAAALEITGSHPHFASGWKFLAVARQRQGKLSAAFPAFVKAAQLLPQDAEAQGNLGLALLDALETGHAEHYLRAALALNLDLAQSWNNLAHGLARSGKLAEALQHQEQALLREPHNREFQHNMGSILHDLGRLDEAEHWYRKALEQDALFPQAHWSLGMCLLQRADFSAGWREYEWRWQTPRLLAERSRYPSPRWTGEQDIRGKTILLWAEQGLGDTLQFCRTLHEVASRGARVLLDVPPAMLRLLSQMAPVNDQHGPLPPHDLHCPLMSLPLALGHQNIAPCAPYLQADPALTAIWAARLGDAGKPRIGIAWAGNRHHIQDYRRSIPIEQFLRLASEETSFVCLQAAMSDHERAVLDGTGCPHFETLLEDYADTAALIANLDLVLCVDTSVAHLAAAMGKPVWLLLSYQADWRWLEGRSDCPWYGSLTILRQREQGVWDEVLDEARRRLRAL